MASRPKPVFDRSQSTSTTSARTRTRGWNRGSSNSSNSSNNTTTSQFVWKPDSVGMTCCICTNAQPSFFARTLEIFQADARIRVTIGCWFQPSPQLIQCCWSDLKSPSLPSSTDRGVSKSSAGRILNARLTFWIPLDLHLFLIDVVVIHSLQPVRSSMKHRLLMIERSSYSKRRRDNARERKLQARFFHSHAKTREGAPLVGCFNNKNYH